MSVLGRVADHAYVGAVVRAECGGLFSLVWNNKGGQTELGTQTLPLVCSINAET